jgi:hypothetical protein
VFVLAYTHCIANSGMGGDTGIHGQAGTNGTTGQGNTYNALVSDCTKNCTLYESNIWPVT